MKLKLLVSLMILVLIGATSTFAAVYLDTHTNYPSGWNDGSNGGEGFLPWTITSSSGSDWAGGGIWTTTNALITGWTDAFGFIAKGANSSFSATRQFRKALDVGDSFELDMAVNWDCGYDTNSLKGFVLFVGLDEVIKVNHDSFPGNISFNGENTGLEYGTYPMHWTFVASDATTITATSTSRDGSLTNTFSTNLTVVSSAISGLRLQAALQVAENEDRRQTYFDNFQLTQAGELPPLYSLALAETNGAWTVSTASNTFTFEVTRDFSDVATEVAISSSDSTFAAPSVSTIQFPIGVTAMPFTVDAVLTGNGNFSRISVSAAGVNGASWEVRGPDFRLAVEKVNDVEKWNPEIGESVNFWVNYAGGAPKNDALFSIISTEPSVLSVAAYAWVTNSEDANDIYIASSVTALTNGASTLEVLYDGIRMLDYNFTVSAPLVPGFTISGPDTLREGRTAEYLIDYYGTINDASISIAGIGAADVSPTTANFFDASGTITATVTAVSSGVVTLTVANSDPYSATKEITITPAPDYSGYLAYDDSSRDGYQGGWTLAPSHLSGFADWQLVMDTSDSNRAEYIEGTYSGAFMSGSIPGDLSGIFEDGNTFGLYANGADGAEVQLLRPFANSIETGQKFSIDLGAMFRDGTKGIKLMGEYDNNWYVRAEFFYNNDGYYYKLDGDTNTYSLGWDYAAGVITVSLLSPVNGGGYVLSFERGQDIVTVSNINSFMGTVDGFQIYSYEGGNGDENNLYFNRMYIVQAETPSPGLSIDGVWNPDAVTNYTFTLNAWNGFTGEVAIASSDTNVAVVSPETVTFGTGETSTNFTVTILALPGTNDLRATITATNVEQEVGATYDIQVWNPFVSLAPTSTDQWIYTFVSGASVWFKAGGSSAYPVEYEVISSVPGVAEVSTNIISVSSAGETVFDVYMRSPGSTLISITNRTTGLGADYGIELVAPTVVYPISPDATFDFTAGTLTFSTPEGASLGSSGAEYATEILNNEWNFVYTAPTVEADGVITVTIPTNIPFAIFRVYFE